MPRILQWQSSNLFLKFLFFLTTQNGIHTIGTLWEKPGQVWHSSLRKKDQSEEKRMIETMGDFHCLFIMTFVCLAWRERSFCLFITKISSIETFLTMTSHSISISGIDYFLFKGLDTKYFKLYRPSVATAYFDCVAWKQP